MTASLSSRPAAMLVINACAVLLAFAAVLFDGRAANAQTQDTFDRIVREKKIRYGYIISPPGAIRDPASGEITGFYVDGARGIAELMKVEPVLVETSWSTFATALQAGQFDISIAATFATIPRAMAVAFTNPIHYQSFSGVARKGEERFKVMADLDRPDVKIAVVQGSAGHEFVLQNLKSVQVVALNTANLQQPFLEVSAGRADVAIQDESQVRRYTPTHPEVVALFGGSTFNTLPLAWAVRRGDQNLLNFLNTAITFMLSSGRWEQYAAKYQHIGRYKVTPTLTPFGNF
jgi:polar amino acid transport system substrate-binding protein